LTADKNNLCQTSSILSSLELFTAQHTPVVWHTDTVIVKVS